MYNLLTVYIICQFEALESCFPHETVQMNGSDQLCGHDHAYLPKFSVGAPVTARPSWNREKQNINPGKLHQFTPNVSIVPPTDRHGWIMHGLEDFFYF